MTFEQEVARKIKNVIDAKGFRYVYICENLGISQMKFSQTMNGKRNLKLGEFLALCKFLNLGIEDFEGEQNA